MTFRVKIVSPIRVDQADLQRRQRRYTECAKSDTHVEVVNLQEGPTALNSVGDLLFCEYRVFEEGRQTSVNDFDAILVDCVFDPAVDALREHTGLPVFGPMRATLSLVPLVAPNFAIISRARKQCEMMADLVVRYGYEDYLVSTHALDISYPEAKDRSIFTKAMSRQLQCAVQEHGARAVVMGSTTMAISHELLEAAEGVPLFLPGMAALRMMEALWGEGLIGNQPMLD